MARSEVSEKSPRRHNGIWDWLGILLSGLCIVHCIGVPLVLLLFPVFGRQMIPKEDITHSIMFAFISGLASLSFISGYRVHGQIKPVFLMAFGILILFYATYFAHDQLGHFWEPLLAILGSIALIWAHFLNRNHCKLCEHHSTNQ